MQFNITKLHKPDLLPQAMQKYLSDSHTNLCLLSSLKSKSTWSIVGGDFWLLTVWCHYWCWKLWQKMWQKAGSVYLIYLLSRKCWCIYPRQTCCLCVVFSGVDFSPVGERLWISITEPLTDRSVIQQTSHIHTLKCSFLAPRQVLPMRCIVICVQPMHDWEWVLYTQCEPPSLCH